jgi:carboxymethylenebutenolidase
MVEFATENGNATGYLALPTSGTGPGVLVLHAWWGLNDVFKQLCDQLAAAGFVAFAPDLYGGAIAETIDEAEGLLQASDPARIGSIAFGALAYLRQLPQVRTAAIGEIGFSMGAYWALLLSTLAPESIAAVVTFYGGGEGDFSRARAAYLGHYAENDPWEPDEAVRELQVAIEDAGRSVTFYTYPGAGHWFFESNRPDAYQAEAAALAWDRTVAFLHHHLP